MKKMKRLLAAVLCCACLCGTYQEAVMAATKPGEEIMPCWNQTNQVTVNLTFKNNVATCDLIILPKSGVTQITGNLILYDATADERVHSWVVKGSSTFYSRSETYSVTAGHRYDLTYWGTVTGSQGTDNISVTKTVQN